MLDDPRAPKHRRRLYIANPDPDDVLDVRDDGSPHRPSYPYHTWSSPIHPPRFIPPLATTNLSALLTPPSDSPAADDPSLPPDPLPLRPPKFARSLAQHAKGPRPADPHARRPRVSPTVSALDTIHSASTPGADKSDINKLLIVVTADSERYVTVDITGARHAAFIRECIFSKLKICQDEEQAQYSIYKTEIGDFAIGDALTDDQLFALCRDRGDNKGSLKFLISHKNAVVHEEPHRPYTPVINPIPPPVLPNFPPSPLRVTPRSRSRHGSASSASEPMTAEATGYEADLDNAEKDKDSHKSAIRHQQQPSITNQLPAPGNLRKVSPPLRPSSPLKTSSSPPISTERSQPDVLVADAHSHSKNNLPSLSPVRPNFPIFEEGTPLPPTSVSLPARSGLDNGESISKTPEQHIDAKAWKTRPQQPQPQHPKLRSESPRREDLAKEHRTRVDETKQELDDWTLISSPAEIESSMAVQEPRTSPTTGRHPRQHDSPSRYVPPGPYPGKSKPPRPPPRHAVPPNYLVTWKGEEGGYRKHGPSSPSTPRLNKGAKSMDNLRGGFSSYTSLGPSPAGYRRNNPLPVSRPSGQGVQRENNYYNGVVTSGLPKSYEPSRPVRPLPLQGSTHSSSLDLSQQNHRSPYTYNSSLSPNNEPLARPQSANGENTASPFSSLRHPNDLLDITRPPRSISPHHSHRTPIGQLSRHHHNDRPADTEVSRTTPPRSPASPRSPQYTPQANGVGSVLSTSSKHGVLDEDELCARSANGQEATLKQEDLVKMSELICNNSESTVIAPRLSEVDKATPPSPGSSTSATTLAGTPLTFNGYDDDSDSELGTMIWKKRPEDVKALMRGPPLTVQTVNRPEETTTRESSLRPNATMVSNDKSLRGSTFTDMSDSTWAPRPLAEDVYDRLEEFFPEHDLDKPVIEASSGSTSPTAAEPASSLAQSTHIPESPEKKCIIRARKSIRYVAEDFKKRIDRKTSAYANIKRNTKLWGSKVEEVTTGQGRSASSISESSPSSAPTFKWVRGELIGKGTFGRVYLAMNANTGEMMAVKQVERPQTASDRNDSRQTSMVLALKLESETLKDLDHPHIVQYLGYEETPTNLSIFLEYVPGGSIGSCLLKHGRFDENVTKSFTYQILDGLHYLHSEGILHRDLKADNILVEMSGICKISDFGISKRTDDVGGGAYTAMQGTVFWMAPEVINTQKKGYNFKIDIWSVGCVVLEMWAGKRPWTGEESVAVMFKLYQSKLPPPVPDDVKLSEQGDDFRSRCFAIDPEERATTTELMAHPYLRLPSDWHFVKFT
ncbi:hypothetical protein APHAL10511_006453 [Amanita phalloides]|nr:hypothetical protein APHAL10511_006453 [Amanita phalloides]